MLIFHILTTNPSSNCQLSISLLSTFRHVRYFIRIIFLKLLLDCSALVQSGLDSHPVLFMAVVLASPSPSLHSLFLPFLLSWIPCFLSCQSWVYVPIIAFLVIIHKQEIPALPPGVLQ